MDKEAQSREDQHSYILDPENVSEMARLIMLDNLVTAAMGGPLSEHPDPSSLSRILDVGSGPGGWVLTTAETYPDAQITGIDVSKIMINFARAQALRLHQSNARFEIMNALEPWTLPESSFDLVNIRYAFSWVPRANWPPFLQQAVRVLRPGGTLRLTEGETGGITSSAAFNEIMRLVTQMVHKMQYGFSPDGYGSGMTPMMGTLLQDAGCTDIRHFAHVLDFSHGTPAHEGRQREFQTGFDGFQKALIQSETATQVQLNRLYAAAVKDLSNPDFKGIVTMITVCGQKP